MKRIETDDNILSSSCLQSPYSPFRFDSDISTSFCPCPSPGIEYFQSSMLQSVESTERNNALPIPIFASPHPCKKYEIATEIKRVMIESQPLYKNEASKQMKPFASLQNLEQCVAMLRNSSE